MGESEPNSGVRVNRYRLLQSLAMGSMFLLAGCTPGPTRQRGVVTVDGVPLAKASVTFIPTDDTKRPASGTTDEDGRFELMTLNPGDGAMAGEYKVIVKPGTTGGLPPGAPGGKKADTQGIHPNYLDVRKTPLLRKVPAPEGDIKLELNKSGT